MAWVLLLLSLIPRVPSARRHRLVLSFGYSRLSPLYFAVRFGLRRHVNDFCSHLVISGGPPCRLHKQSAHADLLDLALDGLDRPTVCAIEDLLRGRQSDPFIVAVD